MCALSVERLGSGFGERRRALGPGALLRPCVALLCWPVQWPSCSPEPREPRAARAPHALPAAAPAALCRPRRAAQVDWDKGTALAHLLELLGLADPQQVFCLYIGDDRTDEDAFKGAPPPLGMPA